MRRRAFTLIELLVVIAIIAMLVSLLTPALARVKHLAKVSICAQHLHGLVTAMNLYAEAENGFLPRHDLGGTGMNAQDVANELYWTLRNDYDIPHDMMFCTESPPGLTEQHYHDYSWFTIIGYAYWVPRKIAGTFVPPDPGGGVVHGTEKIHGPVNVSDDLGTTNPVLTDVVLTWADCPVDTDLSQDGSYLITYYEYARHRWQGILDVCNEAYVDGHVVGVPGAELEPRFRWGNWNWR